MSTGCWSAEIREAEYCLAVLYLDINNGTAKPATSAFYSHTNSCPANILNKNISAQALYFYSFAAISLIAHVFMFVCHCSTSLIIMREIVKYLLTMLCHVMSCPVTLCELSGYLDSFLNFLWRCKFQCDVNHWKINNEKDYLMTYIGCDERERKRFTVVTSTSSNERSRRSRRRRISRRRWWRRNIRRRRRRRRRLRSGSRRSRWDCHVEFY